MAGQATYPVVPDVTKIEVQLTVGGSFGGIDIQTDWYWRDTATHDFAYLDALAEDVRAAWAASGSFIDLYDDTVQLRRVRCTDLDSLVHLSADSGSETGGAATDTYLPLTVCGVVRIPNAEGGAPRSPYVRCGPVSESAVTGNTWVGAHATTLNGTVQAFLTDLAASQPTGELVVISVYEPKASGGGTPSTLYRATGVVKLAASTATSVRPLIGRAGSRLT